MRDPFKGQDEPIAPDVAPEKDQPLDPARAVRDEIDRYADSDMDPNRDDQADEHAGTPDDIV